MKHVLSKRALAAVAVLAATQVMVHPRAQAQQAFPDRPVHIVVPFLAGGSVDTVARSLAQHLQPRLGQQVVVLNQPGGGGNIGHGAAAKSPPDGYTLLVTSDQLSINQKLFRDLPFHALESFVPVVQAIVTPQVLLVPSGFPAKDVAGLVEFARANPGKVNFGSPQIGTVGHLAGELLKSSQKIDIVHVPFQGATAAIKEVMGGQIQMLFVTLPPAIGPIQSGNVRALAASTAARNVALPNVPSMKELGYADFDFGAWQGVFAPAGTPADIVKRLETEMREVLASAAMRERLATLGALPAAGGAKELGDFVTAESAKWATVIKSSQIKVD